MNWNTTINHEEVEPPAQLRDQGYHQAMKDMISALLGDYSPAGRERMRQILEPLNGRLLEDCRADEVTAILVIMIKRLESANHELQADNLALRAENDIFSRSIVGLQERLNAEKSAGKNPGRS